MRAKRVNFDSRVLLDPAASQWQDVPGESVSMGPTPIENQNSRYAQLWAKERPYGRLGSLSVRAAHNGEEIALLLEWEDPSQNLDFLEGKSPDGAGVLFPLNGDAPLTTMGSEVEPVNAWFWRADQDETAENLAARGLGTVESLDDGQIAVGSRWGEGAWRVAFTRPLAPAGDAGRTVRLEAGGSVKVAFAAWDGEGGERAGLKSFSKEWLDLELEA